MITIEQGLQAYRIYAQAAGRSPRTIEWVTRSMHHFIEFLGDGKRYCSQITANDLRRFIIEYSKQHKYEHHPFNSEQDEIVSPVSVQTYVRGIKAFFGYLATDELIPKNVMLKVKTPRVPVMAVPTFTESEIERLLKAPDRQSMTGFRDYANIVSQIKIRNTRILEAIHFFLADHTDAGCFQCNDTPVRIRCANDDSCIVQSAPAE
jgi:site-specific recombinase XerD